LVIIASGSETINAIQFKSSTLILLPPETIFPMFERVTAANL
jgi:hypothetical protein